MLKYFSLITVFLIGASVVASDKLPKELENIGINEQLGKSIDQNLTFKNEAGELVQLKQYFTSTTKPVVLLLAYYGCPNLCNFFLNGVTNSLKTLKWMPGKDFTILTVSIDPRETTSLSSRKKQAHMQELNRAGAENGWHFLVGDKQLGAEDRGNAKILAEQVGFKYRYDKETSQYAHTSAMIFLTPHGKISRYLYGIEFKDQDLRLALSEASGNRIGNIVDRLLLFCYNYDPKARKYSLYAMNVMRAAGGLTVFALAFWLLVGRKRSLTKPLNLRNSNNETHV